MKLLFVACSIQAYELMGRIREKWQQAHPEDSLYSLVKCSALPNVTEKRSLTMCIGEWFFEADAIVFLCATGIAVRCIAPFITHKSDDPAVVVMDETGAFSIAALIIVGKVLDGGGRRSRLYDASFTTGFREGKER